MQSIMNVAYKKDLRNNYMVLEAATDKEYASFCIKMLERQEIDGLLSIEQRLIDNKILLYYDITAKQAIANILERNTLSVNELRIFCLGIIQAIEQAYEYLLPEDDILLAPDFIYQDIGTGKPFLCLYPGYDLNIKEQMSSLMEFLMNKVDYNDKEAVYLVYRLYTVSKEEGYTFEHLKEVLTDKDKSLPESCNENMNDDINNNVNYRFMEKSTDDYIHAKTPLSSSKAIKNIYEDRELHKRPSMQNRSAKIKDSKIPVVMERVDGEEEVSCYSFATYLTAVGCLLAGVIIFVISILSKVIYNSLGTRIDYSKMTALILILACLEGYVMSKLFDKKNRITKLIKTREYIDPSQDYYDYQPSKPSGNNNIMGQMNTYKNCVKDEPKYIRDNSWDYSRNKSVRKSSKYAYYKSKYPDTRDSSAMRDIDTTSIDKTIPLKNLNMAAGGEKNKYVGRHANRSEYEGAYDYSDRHEYDNTEYDKHDEYDEYDGTAPTCLLNAAVKNDSYSIHDDKPILKAMDINYRDIPITSYPFFIGKLKKNVDYCIENNMVSRYHAKITKEAGRFYITDLNSTNGTYINDELLLTYQKKELKEGDIITFANIKYKFMPNQYML